MINYYGKFLNNLSNLFGPLQVYFSGVEILTPIQRVPGWWIGESTSRYGVLAANTRIIYSISSPEPKIREVPWQYLVLCCHPHQGYGTNHWSSNGVDIKRRNQLKANG